MYMYVCVREKVCVRACAPARSRLCKCLCAPATSQFWKSFYGFISLSVWLVDYLLQYSQNLNFCQCIG